MSTDLTKPAVYAAPPPHPREDAVIETVLSAACLAGMVAVNLAVAGFAYHQRPLDQWLWVGMSTAYDLLFAVIVLGRGRGLSRRLLGAGLALAAAAIGAIHLVVFNLQIDGTLSLSSGQFRWIAELSSYAAVTLAALAWGVARRRGWLWLVGVPIAPALSWLAGEHISPWLFDHWGRPSFLQAATLAMLWMAVPLVAMLAGWGLDVLERQYGLSRRRTNC